MYSNKSIFGYSVSMLLLLLVVSLIAAQTSPVSAQTTSYYYCPSEIITYFIPGPNGLPLQITRSAPYVSTAPVYGYVYVPEILASLPITDAPGTPGGLPIMYVPGQGLVVLGGNLTVLGQQYLAQLPQSAYANYPVYPSYSSLVYGYVSVSRIPVPIPITNPPGTPGGLPIVYVTGKGLVAVGGTLTTLGQQYLARLSVSTTPSSYPTLCSFYTP